MVFVAQVILVYNFEGLNLYLMAMLDRMLIHVIIRLVELVHKIRTYCSVGR